MKLTSMKMDPKEQDEYAMPSMACDRPLYPWGLKICLDEQAIAKLGIKNLPEIKAGLMLTARVEVVCTSDNKTESGSDRRLELQITDMELSPESAKADAAKVLFGDAESKA